MIDPAIAESIRLLVIERLGDQKTLDQISMKDLRDISANVEQNPRLALVGTELIVTIAIVAVISYYVGKNNAHSEIENERIQREKIRKEIEREKSGFSFGLR